MAIISTYVLFVNEHVCHCAPCYFVGSGIAYNQYYLYEVSMFGKVKVCGADTVANIYLRDRYCVTVPRAAVMEKTDLPKALREA